MEITSAAQSHTGRRTNNEDSFTCQPGLGLYAVADGMGGYEGGEEASRLAVEALEQFFTKVRADDQATWPYAADPERSLAENLIAVGVRLANQRVLDKKVGPLSKMGSTVAALVLDGDEAVIGHLGDSRVYRLRGSRLEALTSDHSLYAELKATGADLPPKAEYPYANVITRALGLEDPALDLRRENILAGDVFLLCTDGLVEKLPDVEIARLMRLRDPRAACAALVEAAFARGTKDNITCVVVQAK